MSIPGWKNLGHEQGIYFSSSVVFVSEVSILDCVFGVKLFGHSIFICLICVCWGPYKIYKSRKALPTNCQHTHGSILEVEAGLVGFFSIVHPEGNGFPKTGENEGGYIVTLRSKKMAQIPQKIRWVEGPYQPICGVLCWLYFSIAVSGISLQIRLESLSILHP